MHPGARLELYSNPCDGFALVGVEVGDRLLVSAKSVDGEDFRTATSALWRLEGDRAELLVLEGEDFPQPWFTDDRRLLNARTVRDALGLIAPGVVALLEISTLPSPEGDPPIGTAVTWLLLAFVVLLAFGASWGRPSTKNRAALPPRR